jgi:hypothetical protein
MNTEELCALLERLRREPHEPRLAYRGQQTRRLTKPNHD